MSEFQPYSRQIQVVIGPLPEWQGGGEESLAVKLYADGTPDNLRIKFAVNKHIISTASPSTVSVYNLGPKLRSAIKKADLKIAMFAGWANVGMIPVFSGTIYNSVSYRQGADIVTDLISLAGWGGVMRSAAAFSFNQGATLTDIVKTLAQAMPGLSVDSKLIQVPTVVMGNQGWSFAGTANDALDRLGRTYGFSWWIDQGVFYAVSDDAALPGGTLPVFSSSDGSLFRAEPMLASPMQKQQGVTISGLFNPLVQPGRLVQVDSAVNPDLNGSYKVHTLAFSGDSHSSQWDTQIQSWVVVA